MMCIIIKKMAFFLREAISFMIYVLIFFRRRKGVVTLLYHSIGYVDSWNDPWRINVTPENFETHLKVISKYKDRAKVTFDDGYGNNFENAFPLIKKYNIDALIFIVTDFIDKKIDARRFGFRNVKLRPLTWNEIRAMADVGVKFGSHSKTHSLLSAISEDGLKIEIAGSKMRIEEMLGRKIEDFAYPFGNIDSFDGRAKKLLMKEKYNCAYTNIMGINSVNPDNKFALRRIRIYSEDGPLKLKMKIKGAYDWVDVLLGWIRC